MNDPSRRLSSLVILASCVLVCCGTARAALPEPTDVPTGPANVAPPGTVQYPDVHEKPVDGAPKIGQWSTDVRPGEALVATGESLERAELHIWSGTGKTISIKPIRTDRRRLVAILPKDLPRATLLAWPVAKGKVGRPFRINGPEAWWCWPAKVKSGHDLSIRIFGRNLEHHKLGSRVYLTGPGYTGWIEPWRQSPYRLYMPLPKPLEPGQWTAWVHCGSAGRYGWSEPVSFEVVPDGGGVGVVEVDNFGTIPDDGKDDLAAIKKALQKAAEVVRRDGGAMLRFSAGTYHLSGSLVVKLPGIALKGAGKGKYDPATGTVEKGATLLTLVPQVKPPQELVRIDSPGAVVREMTLLTRAATSREQKALSIRAPDCLVYNARCVVRDTRPDKPERVINMNQSALYINAPGHSNSRVTSSEFISPGAGITIGDPPPPHFSDDLCPPSTDDLLIENCSFIGTYRGPLVKPEGRARPGQTGAHSRGISPYNCKRLVVEGCTFRGLDQSGGRILGRMIRLGNSSIRHVYFGDNTGADVGPHASVKWMNPNMGEQILFHLMYPHGGQFDVAAATSESVTLKVKPYKPPSRRFNGLDVVDDSASRVPRDVGQNDHWTVFVCAGRGVGQFRTVTGKTVGDGTARLQLERPWRIEPDASSRVVLQAMYRQNIVTGNTIDGNVEAGAPYKIAGLLFWYNAVDNIVADNTFVRLNWGGVVLDSVYRHPTAWNLVRGNRFQKILPWGAERFHREALINYYQASSSKGWPTGDDRVVYSVGNQFRDNTGTECWGAVAARWLKYGRPVDPVPHPTGAGLWLTVIENNRFSGLTHAGIRLGIPATWTVLNGNRIEVKDRRVEPVQLLDADKLADPIIRRKN